MLKDFIQTVTLITSLEMGKPCCQDVTLHKVVSNEYAYIKMTVFNFSKRLTRMKEVIKIEKLQKNVVLIMRDTKTNHPVESYPDIELAKFRMSSASRNINIKIIS